MNRVTILLRASIILSAALAVAAPGVAPLNAQPGPGTVRSITVSGAGKVTVEPNEAMIPISISTDGVTVDEARKDNDAALGDVRALMTRLGVPESQVKVDYLDIAPQEAVSDDDGGGIVQRYKNDNAGSQVSTLGYDANRNLLIRVSDLTKLEQIEQGLVKMEPVSVGDIQFRTTDMEKQRGMARLLALRDARDKATVMAQELGAKVGKPISISEAPGLGDAGSGANPQAYMMAMYASMLGGASPDSTDLTLGTISINMSVSVVFELE